MGKCGGEFLDRPRRDAHPSRDAGWLPRDVRGMITFLCSYLVSLFVIFRILSASVLATLYVAFQYLPCESPDPASTCPFPAEADPYFVETPGDP
jgi:hypothetical protein